VILLFGNRYAVREYASTNGLSTNDRAARRRWLAEPEAPPVSAITVTFGDESRYDRDMARSAFPLSLLGGLLATIAGVGASAQDALLQLSIGDTVRSNRDITVGLDELIDTANAEVIPAQQLAVRARSSRVVLVGEEHTDVEFHAVQLRVIERLYDAAMPLLIGLEMFPASHQRSLDRWVRGDIDEAAFLDESDWYRVWGYNWNYYRAIFEYARVHQIRLIGLNENAEDGPADTAQSAGPGADIDSDDHRALVRAFFDTDSPIHGGLDDEQFERLFVAQAERDATMAANAARALDRNPQHTMVILAGTGHVLYDLGIARQLPAHYRTAAISVIPVPMNDGARTVSGAVAGFVWGVPETQYPAYPELGVITMLVHGRLDVIHVLDESPAALAGVEVGDGLQQLGDTPLARRSDLSRAMADYAWGDVAPLTIARGQETLVLDVPLRRACCDVELP